MDILFIAYSTNVICPRLTSDATMLAAALVQAKLIDVNDADGAFVCDRLEGEAWLSPQENERNLPIQFVTGSKLFEKAW